MSAARESHPLEERVLTGGSRDLQLAAARGLLPLPPERLVALQVRLRGAEDDEIATAAGRSLETTGADLLARFAAEETDGEVLSRFVSGNEPPPVVESLLRNRSTPAGVLSRLAPTLPPDFQEIVLKRQDAIVEHPEILDALESNPGLTPFARGKIEDHRLHLLRREPEKVEAEPEPEPEPVEIEEATDEEVAEAIETAREQPAEGAVDDATGLSETQIRLLPVGVKLRLSRGASQTLKAVLIRDKSPLIAMSVLTNNAFSDTEIERIAGNRNMTTEILDHISRSRQWNRKYSICRALVCNPKTTTGIAIQMLSRLSVRDLKAISRDHNAAAAVRSAAQRLYNIKRH